VTRVIIALLALNIQSQIALGGRIQNFLDVLTEQTGLPSVHFPNELEEEVEREVAEFISKPKFSFTLENGRPWVQCNGG